MDEIKELRTPATDPKIIHQRAAEDKVFLCLSGLDPGYKHNKASILQSSEPLTLRQAVSKVQTEESRRIAMGSQHFKGGEKFETQTFAVSRPTNPKSYKDNNGGGHYCTNCKKQGHIRDQCWFLYPHLRPKEGPMAGKNSNHKRGEGWSAYRKGEKEWRKSYTVTAEKRDSVEANGSDPKQVTQPTGSNGTQMAQFANSKGYVDCQDPMRQMFERFAA